MSTSLCDSDYKQSVQTKELSGVTIIVCCYNSENRIKKVLEYLSNQITPIGLKWEVIVVDNASKDKTSAVALENWNRTDVPLKVLYEPEPGLSIARRTGIKEASFPYISFIDDDNWVNNTWIKSVFDIMEKNPQIGILGGKGTAVFEGEKPVWFDRYQRAFAVGPQNSQSGRTFKPLYGAGFTLRKSAWDYLHDNGFEFIFSGRKGSLLTSGEDSELCLALVLCGYHLYYNEDLTFEHYMPNQRMNWDYVVKLYQSFGRTWPILSLYKSFMDFGQKNRIIMQRRWLRILFLLLLQLKKWPGYVAYLLDKKPGHPGQIGFNYSKSALVEMISIFDDYPTILDNLRHAKWFTHRKSAKS